MKRRLAAWLLLAISSAASSQAQLADSQARDKAKAAVRSALHLQQEDFLSIKRREDLEEQFLEFHANFRGRVSLPAYVYELSNVGAELEGQGILSHTSTVIRRWFVAISPESGQAYRISGFSDSLNELNGLALSSHFYVPDDWHAQRYASLCSALILDFQPRVVEDSFELKQRVEWNLHYGSASEQIAEQAFRKWWQKFLALKPSPRIEPTVETRKDAYIVGLARVTTLDRSPVLDRWTLEITKNGICRDLGSTRLFPR